MTRWLMLLLLVTGCPTSKDPPGGHGVAPVPWYQSRRFPLSGDGMQASDCEEAGLLVLHNDKRIAATFNADFAACMTGLVADGVGGSYCEQVHSNNPDHMRGEPIGWDCPVSAADQRVGAQFSGPAAQRLADWSDKESCAILHGAIAAYCGGK